MKSKAGFTLIELVITIAIIAIMATLAIPAYRGMIQRNRLDTAARVLQSDLMYARGEAIRRNSSKNVQICPTSDMASCAGLSSWSGNRLIVATLPGNPTPQLMRVGEVLPSTVAVVAAPAVSTLSFTASGMATSAVTFTLCSTAGGTDSGSGRVVSVSVPGKISVAAAATGVCSAT